MSNVPVPYVPYYNKSTADVRSFTDYMRDMAKANIAANAIFADGIKSTLVNNQVATEKAMYNHTREINATLRGGFSGIGRQLGEMNATLVDNQIATEQAMYNNTREINATLRGGFSGVERQLGEMNSAMNMGFAFLSGAVLESSKEICDKLDDIRACSH